MAKPGQVETEEVNGGYSDQNHLSHDPSKDSIQYNANENSTQRDEISG